MTRTQAERRSLGVQNDAQTRPDQTRVFVTQFCGVSITQHQIVKVCRARARTGFDIGGDGR